MCNNSCFIKSFFLTFLFLPTIFSQLNNKLEETIVKCLNSSDCPPYNPDQDLDTIQIARRHGYPAESHLIVTEDGYILTLHRIPGSKTGEKGNQPVFLQHGLLSSSIDWVIPGNDSLAFMLADAGYDVWLGNARGNMYSKAHVNLSIHTPQYWNFSWHEMGVYDLPAALYFVSNITNKPGEIIYIGHSMGTTMFFVFSSIKVQAAKNVKLMVALAPVAYMTHISSALRYIAPFSNDFQWIAKYLGINDFLPHNKVLQLLAYECHLSHLADEICENLVFLLCGFDRDEVNFNILPVVFSHDPAGTSTKAVVHYAQEINAGGKFQRFDYGTAGNLIAYGTPTPPLYKFANIKTPVYLVYALGDKLASPIDVLRLSQNLTKLVGMYKIPQDAFDHVDFIFGKHAATFVNKPVINTLRNFTATDF